MTPFQVDVAIAKQEGEPIPSLVKYFYWKGLDEEYPPCFGRYEKRYEFFCLTGPFLGEAMCVDPSEIREVSDDEFVAGVLNWETELQTKLQTKQKSRTAQNCAVR